MEKVAKFTGEIAETAEEARDRFGRKKVNHRFLRFAQINTGF